MTVNVREFTRNIYKYLKPDTYHITKDGVITFKIIITTGDECDRKCIILTDRGTRFSSNPQEPCEVCGKLCTNLCMTEGKEVCMNCKLGIEGFTAHDGTVIKQEHRFACSKQELCSKTIKR